MKTIDRNQVFALLPIEACIHVMRSTFFKLSKKASIQYLRKAILLPDNDIFGLMPAYLDDQYFGAKVITVFPGNLGSRLPSHQGVVLLFDSRNGELLATVDGNAITQLRTGAVSALATDALARPDASRIAFLGAGAQARAHLAAIRLVRPLTSVSVYDVDQGYAESFAEQARAKYNMEATVANSPKEAVRYADIVCTLTYASEPLLYKADIMPGAHINAIGACFPQRRELSTDLIAASRLFGDDREAVFNESGDFLIPLAERAISKAHYLGDLTQLLFEGLVGRTCGTDITLFKALGLAIEDVAAAKYVYENSL